MCGIAGILSHKLTTDDITSYSRKFSDALKHRGPDDEGSWHDRDSGILVTHRRLSIHDLSPLGAQPMHSESNRYCIVFNGEIYNYLELQKELATYGHRFRGGSDTEVLLAAIEQWGTEEAVKKFTGMFAFALWDKKHKVLQLCRDRMGEKPLYYGCVNKVFYFASELYAIEAACPPGHLKISQPGLQHYLQYGYIASPYSIYNDIRKLPPASILTLNLDNALENCLECNPENYWSLHQVAERGLANPIQDFATAVDQLDSKLHDVIQRQLLADVDVGLFLSGGIDSTTVSAIAQDVSAQQVRTFTIGYREPEYDESGYAEAIARHLGTNHTTLYLSSDEAKSVIPALPKIYDEPFADSSQIPAFLVSRMARQHVTVCLSGDGGDELFAGYNRYLVTDRIWKRLAHIPLPARNALAWIISIAPASMREKCVSLFYKNKQGSIQSKIQKIIDLLQTNNIMQAYDMLSSYWHDPEQLTGTEPNIHNDQKQFQLNSGFIDNAMFIDQRRYLEGDNLTKTDRASMAVSLETRLPLLSHEIIELAWRIPSNMKVHNKTSKWVLRNVLYKYVPNKLINRPKMGFSVPIAAWLRTDLRSWGEDLLSVMAETGNDEHLKSAPIMTAWHEHQSGKFDNSNQLWTILMFLAWKNSRNL